MCKRGGKKNENEKKRKVMKGRQNERNKKQNGSKKYDEKSET